jgi:hypothetical protein
LAADPSALHAQPLVHRLAHHGDGQPAALTLDFIDKLFRHRGGSFLFWRRINSRTVFQLAEVAVPRQLFARILGRITRLCPACASG